MPALELWYFATSSFANLHVSTATGRTSGHILLLTICPGSEASTFTLRMEAAHASLTLQQNVAENESGLMNLAVPSRPRSLTSACWFMSSWWSTKGALLAGGETRAGRHQGGHLELWDPGLGADQRHGHHRHAVPGHHTPDEGSISGLHPHSSDDNTAKAVYKLLMLMSNATCYTCEMSRESQATAVFVKACQALALMPALMLSLMGRMMWRLSTLQQACADVMRSSLAPSLHIFAFIFLRHNWFHQILLPLLVCVRHQSTMKGVFIG